MKVMDQVREVMEVGGRQVFGPTYEKNGVTVIPVARVRGAGGGGEGPGASEGEMAGGVAVDARPAGAFVVKGDQVSWQPAIDVNRMVLGGQILGLVALLTLRTLIKAWRRRA